MSAPFTVGQRVTANREDACCPCGSADLEVKVTGAASGVFACTTCGEVFPRAYADVTAIDEATGHAAGYPQAAESSPRRAGTPLGMLERVDRYLRQKGAVSLDGGLTPRQMRRIQHKQHRSWAREDRALRSGGAR